MISALLFRDFRLDLKGWLLLVAALVLVGLINYSGSSISEAFRVPLSLISFMATFVVFYDSIYMIYFKKKPPIIFYVSISIALLALAALVIAGGGNILGLLSMSLFVSVIM